MLVRHHFELWERLLNRGSNRSSNRLSNKQWCLGGFELRQDFGYYNTKSKGRPATCAKDAPAGRRILVQPSFQSPCLPLSLSSSFLCIPPPLGCPSLFVFAVASGWYRIPKPTIEDNILAQSFGYQDLGTKMLVPCTKILVPKSWYKGLGTEIFVLRTWNQVPRSWDQDLGTIILAPSS